MRIRTHIEPIVVDIDGEEYPIAAKTVAVAEKIRAASAAAAGQPEYKAWLAILRVLLGSEAMEQLFNSADSENIDRIERIYVGVLHAFNAHHEALEKEMRDASAANMSQITQMAQSVNALLRNVQSDPTRDPGAGRGQLRMIRRAFD